MYDTYVLAAQKFLYIIPYHPHFFHFLFILFIREQEEEVGLQKYSAVSLPLPPLCMVYWHQNTIINTVVVTLN